MFIRRGNRWIVNAALVALTGCSDPDPLEKIVIAACQNRVREEVRALAVREPLSTVSPDSAYFSFGLFDKLIKTAQGYEYRMSVNDTFASSSSEYVCKANETGSVTEISRRGP